jgi:hypothetical protein
MSIGIMGIDQISLDPTFVRRKDEVKTWLPVCSTFVPLIGSAPVYSTANIISTSICYV